MNFSVNMKEFREKFQWNMDTVKFGDHIARTNGKFSTLDGNTYVRLLTEMNIFFVAK